MELLAVLYLGRKTKCKVTVSAYVILTRWKTSNLISGLYFFIFANFSFLTNYCYFLNKSIIIFFSCDSIISDSYFEIYMKVHSNTLRYKIKFPGSCTCSSERMQNSSSSSRRTCFLFWLIEFFLRIML